MAIPFYKRSKPSKAQSVTPLPAPLSPTMVHGSASKIKASQRIPHTGQVVGRARQRALHARHNANKVERSATKNIAARALCIYAKGLKHLQKACVHGQHRSRLCGTPAALSPITTPYLQILVQPAGEGPRTTQEDMATLGTCTGHLPAPHGLGRKTPQEISHGNAHLAHPAAHGLPLHHCDPRHCLPVLAREVAALSAAALLVWCMATRILPTLNSKPLRKSKPAYAFRLFSGTQVQSWHKPIN